MLRYLFFSGILGCCVCLNMAHGAVVHSEFLLDANGNVPLDGGNNPIYNEIAANELSGDPANPTQIAIAPGDNTVFGIVDNAFRVTFDNAPFVTGADYDPDSHNVDIFTFDVAPGQTFASLTLTYYDNPTDTVAFLALHNDDTFPLNSAELGLYNFNGGPDVYLGGSVIDGSASGDLGQDILPRLAASGNIPGSFGFSGPLGEGSYSISLQQTGGFTPYALTVGITSVPEPGSAFFVAGVAACCVLRTRRKRSR